MARTAGQAPTAATPSTRGPLARLRPVFLGAVLALVATPLIATSALAAAPSTAPAAVSAVPVVPGPAPYGGLLDAPDPGEGMTTEQMLEVGMLGLGTLNGLAFAVAVFLSKTRGPSVAATRQALITRTAPGVSSGDRRGRRARRAAIGATGVTGPRSAAPHVDGPWVDGPSAAPGAVPAQARAGSGPIPVVPAQAGSGPIPAGPVRRARRETSV